MSLPRFAPSILFAILLPVSVYGQSAHPATKPAAPPSYVVTQVMPPKNVELEVGGMDWMPNGRLAVCIRRGDVWTFAKDKWTLFATGLQEPLGLRHGDGDNDLYVMQRPE